MILSQSHHHQDDDSKNSCFQSPWSQHQPLCSFYSHIRTLVACIHTRARAEREIKHLIRLRAQGSSTAALVLLRTHIFLTNGDSPSRGQSVQGTVPPGDSPSTTHQLLIPAKVTREQRSIRGSHLAHLSAAQRRHLAAAQPAAGARKDGRKAAKRRRRSEPGRRSGRS